MIENNPDNVSSAFEMLLEEIESEIDFVNGIGSKAFTGRDYGKVDEARDRSKALTAFVGKVAALRREWEELFAAAEQSEDEETRAERRNLGKLRKGVRTPEAAYYAPILQALDEMGGSARMSDVLDRVGELMQPEFKEVDHTPLPSNPESPRWRNSAQWARNSMKQRGLLKKDSPRGVWEIADAGRKRLRRLG